MSEKEVMEETMTEKTKNSYMLRQEHDSLWSGCLTMWSLKIERTSDHFELKGPISQGTLTTSSGWLEHEVMQTVTLLQSLFKEGGYRAGSSGNATKRNNTKPFVNAERRQSMENQCASLMSDIDKKT
ncbi:hypothetical protein Tco_0163953 [Tanacetum coccineum]